MPKYPQSNLIHRLFTKGQPLAVGKGEIILGNDPVPDGVYYINTGYVKIYSISDRGDEYVHVIYGNGEIFPLIWAYLNVTPESLYYQSISDCEIWRISRSSFDQQLQQDHELANAMTIQLAHQFLIYSDRVDNLEYKNLEERVAYRLLFLASRFGYKDANETVIDAPITHELFADSINIARESASRVMEKFEKQKIIKKINSRIHILDMDALSKKLSKPVNLDNWYLN
ncbi:MAG: Crp/Fnr family transcriptional regulator [Candidatus Saccharimonadales bacterium]